MLRRSFIGRSGQCLAALSLANAVEAKAQELSEEAALAMTEPAPRPLFFSISLAQWSLHRSLWAGDLDHLDFAATARKLGIGGVEYVNQFFADKAEDTTYLNQMNQRAADNEVEQILIMIDGEGSLGGADTEKRKQAVENHKKWVRAASHLGCHSIRVNAQGKGEAEDVAARVVDSLGLLAGYAAQENINVIVENHGGYSSNGAWLAAVMTQVNLPNCGTLPDFGNFRLSLFPPRSYDRYRGVEELMPWAKGVSAKAYDFLANGDESSMDYARLLATVKSAAYRGAIGIEYEGARLSEIAGILATRNLLQTLGAR